MKTETTSASARHRLEATARTAPEALIERRGHDPLPAAETIGIEAQTDGRFAASFSLHLDGVQRKAESPGEALFDAAILEHLLATPEPGERLQLRYRWHPADFAPELAFQVNGVAVADDREAARRKAQGFRMRVSAMLNGRHDCRFSPATPNSGEAKAHRAQVTFPGLLLSLQRRRPASVPAASFSSILLPSLSFTEARVPFLRALASSPLGLDVVLTIEPARFDSATSDALATAVQLLRLDRAEVMAWPEHRRLHVEELDLWRDHLGDTLRRWLLVPRGTRLAVAFESSRMISDATLGLLARSLFRGRLVAIDRSPARPDVSDNLACTLVLADCLHETATFPALLPLAGSPGQAALPVHLPEPVEALPRSGLVLGEVNCRDVCLTEEDRNRHLYLLGATGCGKSTVLLNLIRQDMEAGHGVCVIDPHGDLFSACLDAVPAHRADQVVMLDVGDYDHAVGLNMLESGGRHAALQRSFIANEMIKIFDRLYDMRIAGGPIFEQYTRAALGLLMESSIQGLTLCEVPTIFEDSRIRSKLIERCTNESVKRFWLHQAHTARGDGSLENMAPYITSKFNQFTHNALIRPIIGQSRSTIEFRQVMDSRGILLVNLSKGLLGEMDSALLGMLILGKIFSASLARAELPASRRMPFALYVDEFQNFATETMGMLLAESRKYGVRLTLANQSLAQIDRPGNGGSIASSVLANVGTIMAMRLGNVDAERLNPLFAPELTAREMVYLPDYRAAVRLLNAGRPMRPFVLNTTASEPVAAAMSREVTQIVRENYRTHYSRDVDAVENAIRARHRHLEACATRSP